MTLLTSLLNKPLTAFADIDYIFHYQKPANKEAPYAVWIEGPEDSFNGDNGKAERTLTGAMEFYTQTEADPKLDEIEAAFVDMEASFELVAVQYEEDTDLIHYSWDWSIK